MAIADHSVLDHSVFMQDLQHFFGCILAVCLHLKLLKWDDYKLGYFNTCLVIGDVKCLGSNTVCI